MATDGKRIKEFLKKLSALSEKIGNKLEDWLPAVNEQISANLNEAVKYSVMAGGKRIRPALCVLVAPAVKGIIFPSKGVGVELKFLPFAIVASVGTLCHQDLTQIFSQISGRTFFVINTVEVEFKFLLAVLVIFALRNIVRLEHLLEHDVATSCATVRIAHRIVVGRILAHTHQEGSLVERELFGCFAKVNVGSRFDANGIV